MIEIIIAAISGGAFSFVLSWVFFYRWKRNAYVTKLKADTTKDDIDTYDMLLKSIKDLREEVEKLSANRHEMILEFDRIKVMNSTAARHWKVIASNCKCNQAPEVEEARKYFEMYESESSS